MKEAYCASFVVTGVMGLLLVASYPIGQYLVRGYKDIGNRVEFRVGSEAVLGLGVLLLLIALCRWLLIPPYKLYLRKCDELKKRDDRRQVQEDLAIYVTVGRYLLAKCDISMPADEELTEEVEQWRTEIYTYLLKNVNRLAAHRFGTPLVVVVLERTPQALLLTRIGKLLASLDEILNTLHHYA